MNIILQENPGLIITIFALFGMCIGSFLNVVVIRLPKDKSVVHPPSSCPKCKKRIRWWDNIPVVSYLALGGWVGGHAISDHDLNTLHVFTAVEISAIPAARLRALRAL